MGLLNALQHKRQHQRQGERIRWWKAIPVPSGTADRDGNGRLLVEQTIDSAARFLVSNTAEDFLSQDWGQIKKGTLQISAFPDWARFNHLDVIALLAPGRLLSAYTPRSFTHGDTSEDAFPFSPIISITNVWIAGVLVDPANYEATDTGVNWLASEPAEGTEYSAEYIYSPRYNVIPNRQSTSPTDKNGVSLPHHYWLNLEQNVDSE